MPIPNPPDHLPGAEIVRQVREHGIDDPRVLDALARISRARFMPPEERSHADDDRAVPIGLDQTISQPFMVAAMTQELALEGTERVLEIGTGSGYQTAVLSALAAEVFTIERLATLSLRARAILDGLGRMNIHYRIGDGTLGWPEEAPFDRILVTAGAPGFPSTLFDQLAEQGILIVPLGEEDAQELTLIRKHLGQPVWRSTHALPVRQADWPRGLVGTLNARLRGCPSQPARMFGLHRLINLINKEILPAFKSGAASLCCIKPYRGASGTRVDDCKPERIRRIRIDLKSIRAKNWEKKRGRKRIWHTTCYLWNTLTFSMANELDWMSSRKHVQAPCLSGVCAAEFDRLFYNEQRPDTGLETRGKSRCHMLLTGLHLRKIFWRKSFPGNNLQHLQKTSAF